MGSLADANERAILFKRDVLLRELCFENQSPMMFECNAIDAMTISLEFAILFTLGFLWDM